MPFLRKLFVLCVVDDGYKYVVAIESKAYRSIPSMTFPSFIRKLDDLSRVCHLTTVVTHTRANKLRSSSQPSQPSQPVSISLHRPTMPKDSVFMVEPPEEGSPGTVWENSIVVRHRTPSDNGLTFKLFVWFVLPDGTNPNGKECPIGSTDLAKKWNPHISQYHLIGGLSGIKIPEHIALGTDLKLMAHVYDSNMNHCGECFSNTTIKVTSQPARKQLTHIENAYIKMLD
ncbi:hypothetical protein F5Y16DRAFT_405753 [Xylariaceae sp. FL0255]|nr:hypothetical protein F5Y16DRAFT_405753 [Xylariaceae sp. FL0255]